MNVSDSNIKAHKAPNGDKDGLEEDVNKYGSVCMVHFCAKPIF